MQRCSQAQIIHAFLILNHQSEHEAALAIGAIHHQSYGWACLQRYAFYQYWGVV